MLAGWTFPEAEEAEAHAVRMKKGREQVQQIPDHSTLEEAARQQLVLALAPLAAWGKLTLSQVAVAQAAEAAVPEAGDTTLLKHEADRI